MLRLGWIIGAFYLIFILVLEYRLIRMHCVNCYYWGKICGFGKGKLSALLFKRGDAAKFCMKEMKWKDMIPDILVALIPFATGVVLLIIQFNIGLLIALVILIALSTSGNGFIRSTLTCKYCKQKELGCPADRLFNRDKQI